MLISSAKIPHRFDKRLILLALWFFCGCSSPQRTDRQVLRLNLHAGLTSLDPAFASNQSNVWMCQQLFSTLVGVDSSGALVPDAARRWARSADGLSYRFELRTDLYFHPHPIFGLSRTRRLTARDVSYTLHRLCQPETGSPGLWILNGKLRGVAAYRTGQADTLAGVAVVNDSTLVLHLEQPFPPFLQLLSMPYAGIVPQEVVAHYGKDFRQHPIGTGPFRFYRWEEGRLLVLHRNPHYYQRGLPRLDAVAVHFIPSKLGAFNAFLEGRIDLIDALDPSYQDELLTATGQLRPRYRPLTFYAGPQLSTEYLGIRLDPTSRHPLQDVRVRQALSLGIDRAGLCRYLLHGTALPAAQGLVPPGMPGYAGPPAQASGYDPARAQALLAAAGYPGGTGLPVLQLYTNPGYAHVAQYLQKNLAALGIRLQLALEEGSTLRERIRKGEALLWRASWVADYADPENFLSLLYSPNHPPQGSATTRYRSPAADAAYEAALRAPDSLRMRYYRQMEEQMLQDVPLIPLYYYKTFRLAQPWVQGMPTQAMNLYFPLKYTAIRPRPVAAGAAAGR